jgi:hypothetical protein
MTGFMGMAHASLLDCDSFAYQLESSTDPECTASIDCDQLQAVQEALALPGVQDALGEMVVTYGRALFPDEGYYRIDVDRSSILLNPPCDVDQTDCVDAPADVETLRDVLEAVTWQGLVQPSCVEPFNDTCDDRSTRASVLLSSAAEAADITCETVDDCTTVFLGTNCEQRCGWTVSQTGQQQLAAATEIINATYCADFETACGPVIVPPCVAPAPVACVDNQCIEDYGEPTL